MNFYTLILLVCISAISNIPSKGTIIPNGNYESINYVIGDISFLEKFGVEPNKNTDEILRIKTHLEYVENLLRQKDVSHLTDPQKEGRETALALLHEYWLNGRFPKNYDYPEQRRPCFEDKDGNICAVGYLIEKTAGHELVEKINTTHQYAYIKDMTLLEVPLWADQYGLTLEECAMIQPTYNHDKDGKMKPRYPTKPKKKVDNETPVVHDVTPVTGVPNERTRHKNKNGDLYQPTPPKSYFCVLRGESYVYKTIKESKENPADSIIKIGIKTDCEPGKEGEWDCYRFITPLKASKLMGLGDRIPRFLIINNIPFTGYLKIVKSMETDINMYVLRFNNGYYESGSVIDNPYCTLRHYDDNFYQPIHQPYNPPPGGSWSNPIPPHPYPQ